MTGLERLRELADGVAKWQMLYHITTDDYSERHALDNINPGPRVGDFLRGIADRIESEQDTLVKDSPYDALPPDDREAIAWVREHGGLEEVEAKWDGRVPSRQVAEMVRRHRAKRERLKEHALWLERKCAERRDEVRELRKNLRDACEARDALRVGLCNLLGGDLNEMLDKDREELLEIVGKRLMPEGMEWPRFDTGEKVCIGSEIDWRDEGGVVNSIELQDVGYFVLHAADGADDWIHPQYFPGERVKRPAKVLDADGIEIREGDMVWDTSGRRQFKVLGFGSDAKLGEYTVKTVGIDGMALEGWSKPSDLTHRAPVIAADGKPLREGETVWSLVSGDRFTITSIDAEKGWPHVSKDGKEENSFPIMNAGRKLTHERPDSWERLEDDATLPAATYCERMGIEVEVGFSFVEPMARDLVRRAKTLAGGA